MFSIQKRSTGLTAGCLLACVSSAASAETLATASFDTDSYIPFRTNNLASPELSIGAYNPSYNFNFGIIEFADLSGVPTQGPKFLAVDLEAFVTLGDPPPGGGPPPPTFSPTGTATIKVVALDQSRANYFSSPSASDWYDTYLFDAPADATATVTQAGLVYFEVTDAVDEWLGDSSSNFGFGVTVIAGDSIELGAASDFTASGSIAPTLTSVPEPSSMALLGLAGLAVLRRRRG